MQALEGKGAFDRKQHLQMQEISEYLIISGLNGLQGFLHGKDSSSINTFFVTLKCTCRGLQCWNLVVYNDIRALFLV